MVNGVEWLKSPSDSFFDVFVDLTGPPDRRLDGAKRSILFISFSVLLTNKNVALIYSVTICEQKSKDCAPSGSLQHITAAPLFLYLIFAALHDKSPIIIMLIVYACSYINCVATCPWLVVVQQRVAVQWTCCGSVLSLIILCFLLI